MIKFLSSFGLCLLLVACGGGSSYVEPVAPTPPPPPPPVVLLDVASKVDAAFKKNEAASETEEPEVIDTVTVPADEDAEPKGI